MYTISDQRKIAFARLPGLIHATLRRFRRLTGFTAVSALRPVSAEGAAPSLPLPLVHPRCARLLRQTTRKPPCEAEWRKHLRFGLKTQSCHRHVCPLGLRCACVPIVLGDELLGFAKFVSGREISAARFGLAVDQLEMMIARPCRDLEVALLQDEVRALRISVSRLERAKRPPSIPGYNGYASGGKDTPRPAPTPSSSPISQVLDYLNGHSTDRELSLTGVASAVRKNEKYLAHLFVQQVGQRMRTYITLLRVRRASELLLATSCRIRQVAWNSGFANSAQFRQAFRRSLGVTASEYRQIFAAGAAYAPPHSPPGRSRPAARLRRGDSAPTAARRDASSGRSNTG